MSDEMDPELIYGEMFESDVAEWAYLRDAIVPRTRCFGKQGIIANRIVLNFYKRRRAACGLR
jgi:hypothetical protein